MEIRSPMLQVAVWEFRRFFKPRALLFSFMVTIFGGFVGFGAATLAKNSKSKPVTIAVINETGAPLENSAGSRLVFQTANAADETQLLDDLSAKKIGGLLVWRANSNAELTVLREPAWKSELALALSEAQRKHRLAQLPITRAQLDDTLASVTPAVHLHRAHGHNSARAELVLVLGLTGLMLIGVLLSFSYQFSAITGEKQARVTEVILSAISPQAWIDGKILGISLLALSSIVFYALVVVIAAGALTLAGVISVAPGWFHPGRWLLFITMALGGLLFWNCFLGAIAATISDPLSSSRSALMFLPLLPLGLGFAALRDPDTLFMRVLSFLPPTSPTVLPARVILGEIAWWEIALSLAVLAGTIWLTRIAAGRVFAASIFSYGKEPGLAQIWRSIRGRNTTVA